MAALHLEGEHLADFWLREKPTLVPTMELDPSRFIAEQDLRPHFYT
ncbi:MAG TPA: hypothetical protein VN647_02375 [Nitrospira sp.]|nr:hypothetical protein [Nitrospira sp.]